MLITIHFALRCVFLLILSRSLGHPQNAQPFSLLDNLAGYICNNSSDIHFPSLVSAHISANCSHHQQKPTKLDENIAGKSSRPPGLKSDCAVKNGDWPTNKFIAWLCPKFKPPPLSLPSPAAASAVVLLAGNVIAPASNCEKERQSDSGSSEKKLETKFIGLGLASAGSRRKRLSSLRREGREIEGLFASV
ncbi:hypothetical protein IEQ34_011917 [Dendrobium chrysotoxum]|uniref:Uncharacterized protein n=1 Tax=Dendrobium chrysotoxum TaxID=161865 RepID=A0AAV7GTT6_DENCH|nr:hypothetical protein IEQ34_011917 [Dendrobium chrysotoxum]